MNNTLTNTIAVVMVTYNPNMQQLEETIQSIAKQVSHVIIIDNGNTSFLFKNIDNLILINLGKNYGIAYAQNYGIELAKQHNADFVLLSDQDTIYPPDFISKMLDGYKDAQDKEHIGAITPVFYDKNKKAKGLISITKFKVIVPDKKKTYYIAHTISSGSLIPVENLKVIGTMREELFIDYVDLEWCGRALKYGYKIISIPSIVIEHTLGDRIKKIGNRKIALRSRARYYYMIRNGIYIIFHTDILQFYEVILFFRELCIKIIGICLIEKKAVPLIYKAIRDGIAGNMYEAKGHV
jgi:rhamnosyltransferase